MHTSLKHVSFACFFILAASVASMCYPAQGPPSPRLVDQYLTSKLPDCLSAASRRPQPSVAQHSNEFRKRHQTLFQTLHCLNQ
jgi:hypothetical protein